MEVGRSAAGGSISFRARFCRSMQTAVSSLNILSVPQQGFCTLRTLLFDADRPSRQTYSHTRSMIALRLDQASFGASSCCIARVFTLQTFMFVYLATVSCLYEAPDCSASLALTKLAVQIIVLLYSTSQAFCYTSTTDFLSSSLFSLHARRHLVPGLLN